jgi:hypothetical protein
MYAGLKSKSTSSARRRGARGEADRAQKVDGQSWRAEVANLVPPDAPVRVEPSSSGPRLAVAVSPLRRRSARVLAVVAGRLDPGIQLSTGGS